MRAGENLVPMTPDMLKRIFAEGSPEWCTGIEKENATPDEVIDLLDTQTFFELLKLHYPTTRDLVLSRLEKERLIAQTPIGWNITNLAALLLAKKLERFSPAIARKAPRNFIKV